MRVGTRWDVHVRRPGAGRRDHAVFAAASPSTVAITVSGGGTALLHRGIDGGTVWQTPFVLRGAPMYVRDFTAERHGVLVRVGPQWGEGTVYQTHDAGATWTRIDHG